MTKEIERRNWEKERGKVNPSLPDTSPSPEEASGWLGIIQERRKKRKRDKDRREKYKNMSEWNRRGS